QLCCWNLDRKKTASAAIGISIIWAIARRMLVWSSKLSPPGKYLKIKSPWLRRCWIIYNAAVSADIGFLIVIKDLSFRFLVVSTFSMEASRLCNDVWLQN